MAKTKTLMNMFSKQYIQEVFEMRLRQEGFVCPDDKLLCWYRMQGSDVVASIVFHSLYCCVPVMLDIGHGVTPVFHKPVFTSSSYFVNRPVDSEERFREVPIREARPNRVVNSVYSEEIPVWAPEHDGRGLYTLETELLPRLENVRTIEDAYLMHKHYRLTDEKRIALDRRLKITNEMETKYGDLSGHFIDMAIWLDDVEVYPYCQYYVEKNWEMWEARYAIRPTKEGNWESVQEWRQRKEAFQEYGREHYLEILNQKRKANEKYIKRLLRPWNG